MSSEQAPLTRFEADLSVLTDAERDAFRACRVQGVGVREFARRTDRRPGTVGNLLSRAERKLDGGKQ